MDSQAPEEASSPPKRNFALLNMHFGLPGSRSTDKSESRSNLDPQHCFFQMVERGKGGRWGDTGLPSHVAKRKLIKDDRKTFFPESSGVLESDCLSVRPAPPPGVWGGGDIND
jgi:hypothetical protein